MSTLPPHAHSQPARRVADAVARAWHPTHGTDNFAVPLSVVAGLALIQPGPEEHALARAGNRRAGEVLLDMVRVQWHHAIHDRPDLASPLAPLALPWHGDHPVTGDALQDARKVAVATAAAGLFDLTAHAETRRNVDVLAAVLMNLRDEQPQQRERGGYVSVAAVSARMPGVAGFRVIRDPALGTGQLWRAVAQAMRIAGRDPAEATWLGLDLEPAALACAATNAITWELGPNVVLGIGGALDGQAEARAYVQREHALQLADGARARKE